MLGGIGVEISSGPQAELTLQWHKAFGLLSLLATVAAAVGFIYSKGRLRAESVQVVSRRGSSAGS